jgi:hypothetical protein
MKTKTFLLLCLFLGIGLMQLSAQKGQNGNGTSPSWWYDEPWEAILFNEDGEEIDVLTGYVSIHWIDHYENYILTRSDYQLSGTLISQKTGEIFKFKEIGKQTAYSWEPITGFAWFTARAVGDHQSHLMMEFICDFSTMEFTIVKISCPGDKYWNGN